VCASGAVIALVLCAATGQIQEGWSASLSCLRACLVCAHARASESKFKLRIKIQIKKSGDAEATRSACA